MPILRYFTFCMSRNKEKIVENFIKPFAENDDLDIFYTNNIPESIKELLVYIAREGVAAVDLFRRPGNTQHIRKVIRQLKRGERIDWTNYNFYTLANIAKRYLLQIDKGVLGQDVESELIATLDLPDDQSRIESMHETLQSLPLNVKQLLALLFGIWFRMIYHSEVNAMSVEAVAKSVAGSIFPSCTINPNQVNKASKVMEYLITGFASAELFGAPLIEYFTNETLTSISRIEKFKYEFIYPRNVSKKKSTRLFVRMMLEESVKHGFDLLRDEVSEEKFNSIDNCVRTHDLVVDDDDDCVARTGMSNGTDCDLKTRKRRLSKTMTYPYSSTTTRYSDQVQQTSEKRTCVTASAGDIGLTTTRSTLDFDISQECVHESDVCHTGDNRHSATNQASSPLSSNRKTARLDLVDDVPMDELIKSELRKKEVENNLKSRPQTAPEAGGRYSNVKLQQLERLQKRSVWFLSAPAGCKSETLMQLSPTLINGAANEKSPSPNSRPMSAEISVVGKRNGTLSDGSNGDIAARQSMSAQISLSDPLVFQSCNGGYNHNDQIDLSAADQNDSSHSEEENCSRSSDRERESGHKLIND